MRDLRDCRVLVTGADGFIGSHLVERLVADGAAVRAFCFYNSLGSLGWLDHASAEIRDAVDLRFGDIRDASFVADSCDGMDVVLHLAALTAVPHSYAAPGAFVETNVIGTFNVLEAVRRHAVPRLVHTSTSEVYGRAESLPIRETHALRAHSPYAASKIGADQLALSYFRSFGTPVLVLRPFNTYGPRQSTRAVIPSILVQLLGGARSVALGRTDPRRDFTYVDDVVQAFVRAASAEGVAGETIQLGTGESPSVAELFSLCCDVVGRQAEIVEDPRRLRPGASEVPALVSDPAVAFERLGWQARIALREGLSRTADWLRANRALVERPFFFR